MKRILREIDNRGGAVHRDVWIQLLVDSGASPPAGNWTFGRRVPFMRRTHAMYELTPTGRAWAAS